MLGVVRQLVLPSFPRINVVLVGLEGEENYRDEDIETLFESEKFSYYRFGGSDIIVYGGTLWSRALEASPSRLFTGQVFTYIAFWYSILYSVVVLSALDQFAFLWGRGWFIALVTALIIHILYNIRLMTLPTIKHIVLLEFGETAEGVKVYVPGPYPLSNMRLKEFYEVTSRKTIAVSMIGEKGREIIATLAVLEKENEVLKMRNAKLLESYDDMEDRVLAEALSRVPKEIIERERAAHRRQLIMLIGVTIVGVFLSFVLGFVMAGGVVGVAP